MPHKVKQQRQLTAEQKEAVDLKIKNKTFQLLDDDSDDAPAGPSQVSCLLSLLSQLSFQCNDYREPAWYSCAGYSIGC